MATLRRALWVTLLVPLAGCGGGSGGGGSPTAPPTPPPPTYTLSAVVFYDQNGNGTLDADEDGRLPGVTVEIAGHRGSTEALTGRARVSGVPAGSATATVRADSLPMFWVPGAGVPVDVPSERELELPVTLPIGGNNANLYLAFGDSITAGDGSSDGYGYTQLLEDRLRAGFGVGEVRQDGLGGTTSEQGAARLGTRLNRNRPAFTLILYGTNDWNICDEVASCFTLDAIGAMIAEVKARGSLPVVGTIPPVNVGYDARTPPSRNDWVAEANVLIRDLARRDGALLADVEKVLLAAATGGNFAPLFDDHVHPNDRGYQIIADEFYRALSTAPAPAGTSSFAHGPLFGPLEAPAARPLPQPGALPALHIAPIAPGPPERGVRALTRERPER